MPEGRIHRLLRLIALLQRGEPTPGTTIMRELGISRRTLFRDLEALGDAGVPYQHNRRRGYFLDKTFYLPPISLTLQETLGLMLMGKLAAAQFDKPLMGPALTATRKLRGLIADPIRQACDELMENVSVALDSYEDCDVESRYHHLLQRYIDEECACRVIYKSPSHKEPLHAVLYPYLLHFVSRAWYVLGHTDVDDEVRMFKLACFTEIEPTDETFSRPSDFRVEDRLGAAWRMLPEGREYEIELEFSAKVAESVGGVLWHPSQKCEHIDDDRCRFTFKIDGLGEIAWWICGYADQVLVVTPKELRDQVAGMHRAAADLYDQKGVPGVVTLGVKPNSRRKNPHTTQ